MLDASLGQLRELERLQGHFMWVLALLRAQDHDHEDAAWRDRRARTLDLLERYSAEGRFPRNELGTGTMVPVFIDRHGTTCAVAELMSRTGHADLAEQLHRTMNFSYVDEMLQQHPEDLARWAEHAGLSAAEVALVQPDYCEVKNGGCYECCQFPESETETCEPYTYPDGESCCLDNDCKAGGVCQSGDCVPKANAPAGGCAVAPDRLATGSVAPLLAALFLLSVRRGLGSRRARRLPD